MTSTFEDYFGNVADDLCGAGRAQAASPFARRAPLTVHRSESCRSRRETPPWEAAADRAALPFDAVEFVFDSHRIEIGVDRSSLRARVVSAWPAAARRRPRADRAHPRRVHLRPEGHDRRHAADRGLRVAPRRLSGFRPHGDRLPALARAFRRGTSAATWRPCRRPALRRLIGADASHAWLTVYCPGIGWIPVDPTNNLLPSDTHVTLAWGRDYNDVRPIHGVILGGGAHALRVRVDVVRLA